MIDNTLASFTQHHAVRKVIAPVESGVAALFARHMQQLNPANPGSATLCCVNAPLASPDRQWYALTQHNAARNIKCHSGQIPKEPKGQAQRSNHTT